MRDVKASKASAGRESGRMDCGTDAPKSLARISVPSLLGLLSPQEKTLPLPPSFCVFGCPLPSHALCFPPPMNTPTQHSPEKYLPSGLSDLETSRDTIRRADEILTDISRQIERRYLE